MPYFKLPGKRKYEYEPAIGELKFSPENLDSDSRQVFDVLHEIGVKTVYCRYNGGHDEGFADLTGAKLEDRTVEFEELKSLLAESSLGSKTSENLIRYYAGYTETISTSTSRILSRWICSFVSDLFTW